MDETLNARLPHWFAISNSTLKGNSKKNSNFYWNLIKLYSTQDGCSQCVFHMQCDCLLAYGGEYYHGLPSHHSISASQLKYQIKKYWPKVSVLYEQLLSSVSYTRLSPIYNSMFMFFVYWTFHQLLWSKIDLFLQI